MHFFIRVDSSFQIGSGHLMRCLTLAETLRASSHKVSFICADLPGSMHSLASNRSYNLHLITPTNTQVQDQIACKKILENADEDSVVIVDHYGLDYEWEEAFFHNYRLVVIDDLINRKHCCHVLIDVNFRKSYSDLYRNLVPIFCHKILGPQHSFLRPQVTLLRSVPALRQPKVLVFFGGTDPGNDTKKFLEAASSASSALAFTVVITSNHTYKADILSTNLSPNVELVVDPDFPALLLNHSLFLGSGGTVTWERLFLGLPGLVVATADNQVKIAEDLASAGYQLYLGMTDHTNFKDLILLCEKRISNHEWLENIRNKGKALVNNFTAENLLEPLELVLRDAGLNDAVFLFELRNDPLTRDMSKAATEFSFEDHKTWLQNRIKNNNPVTIIILNGKKAGQLRIDLDLTVSISIAAEYRGKNIARRSLTMAIEKHFEQLASDQAIYKAQIKKKNEASIKTFEHIGFVQKNVFYKDNEEYMNFEYVLKR